MYSYTNCISQYPNQNNSVWLLPLMCKWKKILYNIWYQSSHEILKQNFKTLTTCFSSSNVLCAEISTWRYGKLFTQRKAYGKLMFTQRSREQTVKFKWFDKEFDYQLGVGSSWQVAQALRKWKYFVASILKLSPDLNYKSGIAIQNKNQQLTWNMLWSTLKQY
jgi:hypothetical protein